MHLTENVYDMFITGSGHFPDWTFPRLDNSPTNISPSGYFPEWTFPPSIHIISEPTFP